MSRLLSVNNDRITDNTPIIRFLHLDAVQKGESQPRLALARAAQLFKSPAFDQALRELARAPEANVRDQAVRAMKGAGRFLPDLVSLLADHGLRESARKALIAEGELALQYLDRCLSDSSLPLEVRRHIPRTISRFAPYAAVEILVRSLPAVARGMVRYKILRGLGKILADNPNVKPDRSILSRVEKHTLKQCFQLLAWRVTLQGAGDETRDRTTPRGQLLIQLLRSKENYAIERLFRLLDVLEDNFDLAFRGLRFDASTILKIQQQLHPSKRGNSVRL